MPDFLDKSVKTKIDVAYRLYIEDLSLLRFRIVFFFTVIFYPVFNFFDRIVYPTYALFFLKIRIVCTIIGILFLLVSFYRALKPYMALFSQICFSLLIISVIYMVYLTDGSSSKYYEGLNLVFLGIGFSTPFYVRSNIFTIVPLILLYDLAMMTSHSPFNATNFYLSNYFMGLTAFAVFMMSKFYSDEHYKAFAGQEQLKISAKALEDSNKKLANSINELARSNQELEQFAYVASHDMQEPLRMIASFCQKLEQKYKDRLDADANEYIHFAVDGAKRLQALISGLLVYARLGKKNLAAEAVDLNKILQALLQDLDFVIKEKEAVVNVGELPVVLANEVQMSQLFRNFLTNALKFVDKKPVINISAKKKDGIFEFMVTDNGIGIAPEDLSKIFVLFQRIHEKGKYPGTGIGLATCKKIVENFNGKIRVDSKPDEGTAFYFTLDVKEAPA